MAERRMFAKTIIDSDAFLDMPVTARLLYYDLAMRADDDGFVNSPKKIMRMVGASQDDLAILIMKKFLIPFENGVVVIKHWKIHNYIQSDRYKPTPYQDEKAQLEVTDNKAYRLKEGVDTPCIHDVSTTDTQVRDRLEIGKSKVNTFTVPTVDEVRAYCNERKNNIDPEAFIDHYDSNGWMVGKTKMKDWKAAVRNWERNRKETNTAKPKDGYRRA